MSRLGILFAALAIIIVAGPQPVRALENCYVVRATADARNPQVSTERAEHRLHRHILHELRSDSGKSIGPVRTHCIRNACESSALVCHH